MKTSIPVGESLSQENDNTDELEQLKQGLAQLKQSFDSSFNTAPNLVAEKTTPLLLFKLGHEVYAITLSHIQQVLVDFDITVLPFTPGFIEGVINLNGDVLSVSNIHGFFNLSHNKNPQDSKLIVLKNLDFDTALLVDDVLTAVDIQQSQLNRGGQGCGEFVEGTFLYKGQLAMLIAIENLMASPLMQVS